MLIFVRFIFRAKFTSVVFIISKLQCFFLKKVDYSTFDFVYSTEKNKINKKKTLKNTI